MNKFHKDDEENEANLENGKDNLQRDKIVIYWLVTGEIQYPIYTSINNY